jgi:hypothetical protein
MERTRAEDCKRAGGKITFKTPQWFISKKNSKSNEMI